MNNFILITWFLITSHNHQYNDASSPRTRYIKSNSIVEMNDWKYTLCKSADWDNISGYYNFKECSKSISIGCEVQLNPTDIYYTKEPCGKWKKFNL